MYVCVCVRVEGGLGMRVCVFQLNKHFVEAVTPPAAVVGFYTNVLIRSIIQYAWRAQRDERNDI